MDKKQGYDSRDISVLEGLDPIRKRPGMYIGSTGNDGLHHLIKECLDNSLDEAMGGYAKNIKIAVLSDDIVSITDDGRGIPIDIHEKTKKSGLETVMTTIHAGGKFGGKAYQVSGGLHGVGVSVVCALSEWIRADVYRDGYHYYQEYKKGVPTTDLIKEEKSNKTGTVITFKPDIEIFKEVVFHPKEIMGHIRQQAYLTKGIKINFRDSRGENDRRYSFYFEGGVASYVKYLTRGATPIHSSIFYCTGVSEEVIVEAAFRYTQEYEVYEESFANNIITREGGTHLTGFRGALTKTINNYGRRQGILKENDENLKGEDIREGLTSVVSVKIREPQFEGQTKNKLGNLEARTAVDSLVSESLIDFFEKNPQEAKEIIGKCLISAKARRAARAVRQNILRKGVLDGLALPGKLSDCSTKKPEESEIYVIEGESAGGCFSGETKIALTDGRNISFEDLVKEDSQGKKNYCYTIKDNGSVGVELIKHPRKTKKGAEVIRLVLDNDEEITCTPDHKFMMKDGSYKKAEDINPYDSLTPLKRKLSEIGKGITIKGYEMVFDQKQYRWIFTHLLSDRHNLENKIYSEDDGSDRHHKDFNKLNNNPENITRMPKEEYMEYHRKMTKYGIHSEKAKQKSRKTRTTNEYRRKKLSIEAKKQWKNRELLKWRSSETKKQWNSDFRKKRRASLNRTYQEKALKLLKSVYEKNGFIDKKEYQKERFIRNDRTILKYETLCEKFFKRDEEKLKEAIINYNHKIKKIIRTSKKIDVYDIEVEKTHNFALASGVFVHNSCKSARDRRFQAILPLKGKILNVERSRLDRILESIEIKSLIIAMGAAIAEDFDIEKLRYHRIILMADADSDGNHIKTLLLTLFYRYFRPIIEKGYLYLARPPLYKIQIGKRVEYAYTEADKAEILGTMDAEKADIQRYKGLGEMNPSQLWETTMNPENRVLMQVNIDDAKDADKIFDTLMGQEVQSRKTFIKTHAKEVANLDI
ncbi:MAG: ATP-binding protein [Patescibacteria group bacterium]|nr:ATP-binding protein [Patescibacteria group bacterium]